MKLTYLDAVTTSVVLLAAILASHHGHAWSAAFLWFLVGVNVAMDIIKAALR